MDKIIKIVFLFIVLSSCTDRKKSSIEGCKIIFYYDKSITVDFEKNEIRLNEDGFEYKDTIVITNKEDSIITNSYKKNRIDEIKGKLEYQDCRPVLIPKFENRIEIYTNEKLKATISINSNHDKPSSTPSINSQEYRIFCFHDDLKKVILNKKGFVRALDAYRIERFKHN